MTVFVATIVAFGLMAASVWLQYRSMVLVRRFLRGSDLARRSGVFVGMASVLAAQLFSVGLYAVAYFALEAGGGFGSLSGETEGTVLDFIYFSMMSYTTLGVGDIYPTGALRLVSGVQALNGFALIGWTASFAYTLMRQGWED